MLALPIRVWDSGIQYTLWDGGEGTEGGRRETVLHRSGSPHLILIALETPSGAPVRRIRIQPFDVFARFHLGPPELWHSEPPGR